MSVNVNGIQVQETKEHITENVLTQGSYALVTVTLKYESNGARADGPFSVSFGDLSFDYSTAELKKILSFTINNDIYQFEEGMTWEEWLNSKYNEKNAYYESGMCFDNGGIDVPITNFVEAKDYGHTTSCPT